MDLGISGKVALCSGASAGMGHAIARTLAANGAKVMLVARTADNLQAVAKAIPGSAYFAADMSKESDIARAVEATTEAFGSPDIVISNTSPTNTFSFATTEPAEYYRMFDELVMSLVHLARLTVKTMQERKWGRIVNINSVCAKEPHRYYNLVLSNVGRPAVQGLVKTLSNEYAQHGITVNTILPGLIDTGRMARVGAAASSVEMVEPPPRIPVGRQGAPDEIAAACAFLCSVGGAYVTGQAITVDGGWTRGLF